MGRCTKEIQSPDLQRRDHAEDTVEEKRHQLPRGRGSPHARPSLGPHSNRGGTHPRSTPRAAGRKGPSARRGRQRPGCGSRFPPRSAFPEPRAGQRSSGVPGAAIAPCGLSGPVGSGRVGLEGPNPSLSHSLRRTRLQAAVQSPSHSRASGFTQSFT